ncbi:zinc-ribbon domain-containing protein, partial [Staphylococcus aureus]|nr:zinc-ribbon domain-containing protein [Staphylococcus aureus]
MRLTCPECDAQYEVEDSLIPPGGRSVECARCGHMWHQPGIGDGAMRLGD